MKNIEETSAIIPVAGIGTRLRPHTHTWPKVLLTVGDKPILGHILDEVKNVGIKRVYLIIGHFGEKIKKYVATYYPELKVEYILQKEQKGLGHAVWMAKDYVRGPLMVLLGDTIISADLKKFLFSQDNAIALKEVEDPKRFGVAVVKNGYVARLVEKPEKPLSNLAVVGIYTFKKSEILFKSLEKLKLSGRMTKGEMQLTDALEIMIRSGHKIKPIMIEGWHDCGKKETIIETNKYILKRKKLSARVKGVLVQNPVYIAKSARIKNSIIGPYTSVGEHVQIEDSIITDSIINQGAVIHNMNLDKSLIGPDAVLKGRVEHVNIGENSEIKFEN